MKTLAEVTAAAKPRTQSTKLCLRGDLIAEHERLDRELRIAREREAREGTLGDEGDLAALAEQVQALEAEMAEHEVEFVFQSIGPRAWKRLEGEHAPTKEQREQARVSHNPETFPPAAVLASLISPEVGSEEEFEAFLDTLTEGQWRVLYGTCLEANMGFSTPGESEAASAVLQRSRQPSDTAGRKASRTRRS